MNQMAPSQQINIELRKKEDAGSYSNFASIRHSPAGFFQDFTRMLLGVPKNMVCALNIIEPRHAKSLFETVRKNRAAGDSFTPSGPAWRMKAYP